MEFRHWLDSWAEVNAEFHRLSSEAQNAERARARAAGTSRYQLLPDGGETAIAYAEEQGNRLLELLNQHAHEWQNELAGFAASLTQETIGETFPRPAQWQTLRGIASHAKLSPEAVISIVERLLGEEDDTYGAHFFLQQAPFLPHDLSRSDMQSAFADFLDGWSGEKLDHPVLSGFSLARLSDEISAMRLPLHAAAVKEYELVFFEDEITFLNPVDMGEELGDLLFEYADLGRGEDAARVQARLEKLSIDGAFTLSVYEDLAAILADAQDAPSADEEGLRAAFDQERRRAEDRLVEALGQVWQSLHGRTRRSLIQAEVARVRQHADDFCEVTQYYYKAIEAEWRHQVTLWSGERLSQKANNAIWEAIKGHPGQGKRLEEFVTQCPDAWFLYGDEAHKILGDLRRLRGDVVHPEDVEPDAVRDIVERLWEDGFLKRYFEALVTPRRPQLDAGESP